MILLKLRRRDKAFNLLVKNYWSKTKNSKKSLAGKKIRLENKFLKETGKKLLLSTKAVSLKTKTKTFFFKGKGKIHLLNLIFNIIVNKT